MNAPTLTPAEIGEAVRFGIQDEEAFESIVEHFEVISCEACEAEAEVRVELRCCKSGGVLCGTCRDRRRRDFEAAAALATSSVCTHCQTPHGPKPEWERVFREVPL